MDHFFNELQESEANLNSLINNRNESIWSIDKDYNYVIINDFFKEAYLAAHNIELKKGLNALDILSPELLDFWKPKYDRALIGERVVFEFSYQIREELHFYNVTLNPIISEGQITGVSCLSIDITDRENADSALQENKANLAAIIENTTDSIWAINSSYEIIYVNAVFATAFEASFGSHLEPGENLLLSLPEPIRDMWKSRYDRVLNNERFSIIDKIDLENGSIYIEVLLNPIAVDDKVVGVSFFGRDITERKQIEEDTQHQNEELINLNKTKDKFFSIIAHDLRSPFTALIGISQMISEDMDNMSVGEVKQMTSAIYHSTQNLNKLIENLLNWSLLQMGTFEVSPKKINLKKISQNVLNILELSAIEKKIKIQDNIADTNVFADEDCTKTILRNLVSNAIKYTTRGGEIKLYSKPSDNLMEITVEDNGIGMAESTIKKLFSITEKVSEAGTEKELGTGLGLILCKELIEKNNGKIWIESELGKGSKITFSLPEDESV